MQLIDSSESMEVFAFLDLENPAVAWAVMRGALVSADQLRGTDQRKGFISFMLAGMIQHQSNYRLFNESIIEAIRQKNYPTRISRLTGLYFFLTRADAEARIGDRKWPPYFKRSNLVNCHLRSVGTPTIADSDWITYAPLARDGRIIPSQSDWISKYWSGIARSDTPSWEIIANGVALVADEAMRRRCWTIVNTHFPNARIPILMARLASEAGSNGGLITPFLLGPNEDHIELCYVGNDADFHNPEVIKAMLTHPDALALGRLMNEQEEWWLPDFRPWGCVFRAGIQAIDGTGPIVGPSIHHNQ